MRAEKKNSPEKDLPVTSTVSSLKGRDNYKV